MRVLGVDACKAGWIGIVLDDGAWAAACLAPNLADVLAAAGAVQVIGIDMPLGHVARGWRDADLAAAAFLGPRRSSVFRMPPDRVLAEPDFAAASALSRELAGGGISRQLWGLRSKLGEANRYWHTHPGWLYEVHPEVSFRALAGSPLPFGKHTWSGHGWRRALLREAGIQVPDEIGEAGRAGPDDVLDAAAAGWSAHRIATGAAASLPDPPQTDVSGRPVAIWY